MVPVTGSTSWMFRDRNSARRTPVFSSKIKEALSRASLSFPCLQVANMDLIVSIETGSSGSSGMMGGYTLLIGLRQFSGSVSRSYHLKKVFTAR